jgi:pimeloyl-ACP methyl ester carboxylesterase
MLIEGQIDTLAWHWELDQRRIGRTDPDHRRARPPSGRPKAGRRRIDSPSLKPKGAHQYVAPWQGENGQAAYFRKIAQWTDDDVGALEPLLPTLRVPVRILWGEEDRWLDRSVADRLRALIPDGELRLIPDAGHFSPEDAPPAVARELLEFFAA